jgi:hypothetical protein
MSVENLHLRRCPTLLAMQVIHMIANFANKVAVVTGGAAGKLQAGHTLLVPAAGWGVHKRPEPCIKLQVSAPPAAACLPRMAPRWW